MSELRTSLVDVVRDPRSASAPGRRVPVRRSLVPTPHSTLTAGDLDRACRTIAASLAPRWEPGTLVVLLLPAGRPFVLGFLGCQFAGLVPVPVAPPGRAKVAQGLLPVRRIVEDCRPSAVLTTAALAEVAAAHLGPDDALRRTEWTTLEAALSGGGDGWEGPVPDPDGVAFVQYTSGSMSSPRGVRVLTRNLLANLDAIQRGFATSIGDQGVIWLPTAPRHGPGGWAADAAARPVPGHASRRQRRGAIAGPLAPSHHGAPREHQRGASTSPTASASTGSATTSSKAST